MHTDKAHRQVKHRHPSSVVRGLNSVWLARPAAGGPATSCCVKTHHCDSDACCHASNAAMANVMLPCRALLRDPLHYCRERSVQRDGGGDDATASACFLILICTSSLSCACTWSAGLRFGIILLSLARSMHLQMLNGTCCAAARRQASFASRYFDCWAMLAFPLAACQRRSHTAQTTHQVSRAATQVSPAFGSYSI